MNSATEKFLAGLKSNELLLKLTWDEWLCIDAPYSPTGLTTADAWTRELRLPAQGQRAIHAARTIVAADRPLGH